MSRSLPQIASISITSVAKTFDSVRNRLSQVASDSEAQIDLVRRLITKDPLIAATVLSRANAASPTPQNLVSQCIAMLGLSMVHGLSFEIEALNPAESDALAESWTNCIAASEMMIILAQYCRNHFPEQKNEELLGLIGLLHNLGAISSRLLFPKEYTRCENIQRDSNMSMNKLFRMELGISCTDLGTLVAKAWHLPPIYQECIRYHRRPDQATQFTPLVQLTHITQQLIRGCGFVSGSDIFVENISHQACEDLGLREKDILAAINDFMKRAPEIAYFTDALKRRSHNTEVE